LHIGGDAFLESTPPVLTYYQARSGQQFTLAMTVERLRAYGQKQLSQLKLYLADAGIEAIGANADHGAFLSVHHTNASDLARKLAESNVITDARGEWLRLCPDCLTRDEELQAAASALHKALEQMHS
jgi:kynureninase